LRFPPPRPGRRALSWSLGCREWLLRSRGLLTRLELREIVRAIVTGMHPVLDRGRDGGPLIRSVPILGFEQFGRRSRRHSCYETPGISTSMPETNFVPSTREYTYRKATCVIRVARSAAAVTAYRARTDQISEARGSLR